MGLPNVQENLIKTLWASRESAGRRFSDSKFFRRWFRLEGAGYFFLFRKNLKVTNIQFAELLALIRSHTRPKGRSGVFQDLQFLTAPEFRVALRELIESFPPPLDKKRCELIAKLYAPILERQVVIESLFGSCAVYVPPHLEIDLKTICAQSGYIHSCGRIVYVRNISKANKRDFVNAMRSYLEKHHPRGRPFFTVYAHEDFSKHDRGKQEYLRNGLEDVKVYVEKFYMDAKRLVDVLKEIQRTFRKRLTFRQHGITRNGDNQAEFPTDVEETEEALERRISTIWLLVDHSVGQELRHRGDDRYYICYEQQYMNDNAFYLFDENKPAWLAPTTIPHTLVSAMLNLAGLSRVASSKGPKTVLADPFVGAGTTWLEALKFGAANLQLRCSDQAPIANLLAADNLAFFSADIAELEKFLEVLDLKTLEHDLGAVAKLRKKPDILKAYRWAEKFVRNLERELRNQKKEGNFSSALTRDAIALLPTNIEDRLFFYLLLRSTLLNIAASKRVVGSEEKHEEKSIRNGRFLGFSEQAQKLTRQIELLKIVRTRESKPELPQQVSSRNQVPGFNLFTGRYSLAYSIRFSELKDLLDKAQSSTHAGTANWNLIREYDVMTPLPKDKRSRRGLTALDTHTLRPNSCDVIVTDPPYGFNTDEDPDSLASLYTEALHKMIKALKNNGQLVLCLLDRSHTGRRSPFFSHKELIIQQVLSIADRMGREVIIPAFAVPHQREIFRPPYYWESERALRRAILHFKFRTK